MRVTGCYFVLSLTDGIHNTVPQIVNYCNWTTVTLNVHELFHKPVSLGWDCTLTYNQRWKLWNTVSSANVRCFLSSCRIITRDKSHKKMKETMKMDYVMITTTTKSRIVPKSINLNFRRTRSAVDQTDRFILDAHNYQCLV